MSALGLHYDIRSAVYPIHGHALATFHRALAKYGVAWGDWVGNEDLQEKLDEPFDDWIHAAVSADFLIAGELVN